MPAACVAPVPEDPLQEDISMIKLALLPGICIALGFGGSDTRESGNRARATTLEAAWVSCVTVVPHNEVALASHSIDPGVGSRFIRLIEQHIGVKPPKWWREAILGGTVGPECKMTFIDTCPNRYYTIPIGWTDGEDRKVVSTFNMPKGQALYVLQSAVRFSARGKKATLPFDALEFQALEGQFDTAWTDDHIFIANHARAGEHLQVTCINLQTRRPVWTRSFSDDGGIGSSGKYFHNVVLRVKGKKLFIYGASNTHMYVLAASTQTGLLLSRFSTLCSLQSSRSGGE